MVGTGTARAADSVAEVMLDTYDAAVAGAGKAATLAKVGRCRLTPG